MRWGVAVAVRVAKRWAAGLRVGAGVAVRVMRSCRKFSWPASCSTVA